MCDSEPADTTSLLTDIPEDVQLHCVQNQKCELERRQSSGLYRAKAYDKMKYRIRDGPWKHEMLSANPSPDSPLASYPDILVTVHIYRPFLKRKPLLLDQEFQVLGQQKLTELRDKIICMADHIAVGEFSENPNQQPDILTKDLYKSAFFFIEGVFYNDMRDSSCNDLSRVIIDWAKDANRGIGPFSSQRMETTHFIDLTARLGQPYVYVHQGDCEHVVVLSDLRLMHREDCRHLDRYPISIYKSRERKPTCRVCQNYLAKWVTSGSTLAPEDPCFFCDTCFRALHYDNAGRKTVPDMRAYPYPDIRHLKQ